eukprot:2769774-Pleurochrysis_carterae.AAC.2
MMAYVSQHLKVMKMNEINDEHEINETHATPAGNRLGRKEHQKEVQLSSRPRDYWQGHEVPRN